MKKLLAILLVLIAADTYAQHLVSDTHTTVYVISDTESIKEAELNAVKQAQLEMIAKHFGTIVASSDYLTQTDKGTSNFSFADIEVKGEWVETISEPIVCRSVRKGHFVLDVTVSGRIKEIVNTPIDLHCKVLRNGDSDHFEDTSFKHGDYMYLSFKTPVDGYLTVYLTDGETVQCLYPYKGLSAEYMQMEADNRYVFFSKQTPGNLDPNRVPRMRVGCASEVEYDRLYVVFSPNRYVKAVDEDSEGPRWLGFKEFQTWLSRIRRIDKDMNVRAIDIEIRK